MKLLSKSVLKQSLRNNWKLWLILTAILCLFITAMTIVAPNMEARFQEALEKALAEAELARQAATLLGEDPSLIPEIDPTKYQFSLLGDLYARAMFGMMGILLMLIYAITVGNKLVASEIDRGTMSFTLNTPITRTQIILSKALFYILSLLGMAVTLGVFGTVISAIVGIELEYGLFWLMILGFFLYGIAISGICFFASCWFNKSGNSLLVGTGLPVLFLVLISLSEIQELEWLKYFSLNTLFDTTAIAAGEVWVWWQFIAMFVMGIALYIGGIVKFLKKDLPL